MYWFFALNEQCRSWKSYFDLIKVAVLSAQSNTQLQPCFIYDGAWRPEIEWLKEHNVAVFVWKSRFYHSLKQLSEKLQQTDVLTIGAGAFLRIELPEIAKHYGLNDSIVLYTDCDVMFLQDPTAELQSLRCKYFAVAPEFNPEDYHLMNTGVMLMNLKTLAKRHQSFHSYIEKHLEKMVSDSWDQAAYRAFFGRKGIWKKDSWDRLPLSLNWKPYWGDNEDAKIIHFHGPKPFMRLHLAQGSLPPALTSLVTPFFEEACRKWDDFFHMDPSSVTPTPSHGSYQGGEA